MNDCRPHRWQYPKAGDVALICARCGRALAFSLLMREHHRRRGVIRAALTRLGRERGERFCSALAVAMNAYMKRRPEEVKP